MLNFQQDYKEHLQKCSVYLKLHYSGNRLTLLLPKNVYIHLRWGVIRSLLLLTFQALEISQNLKDNELHSANSEQKPIYVPSAAKVLIDHPWE